MARSKEQKELEKYAESIGLELHGNMSAENMKAAIAKFKEENNIVDEDEKKNIEEEANGDTPPAENPPEAPPVDNGDENPSDDGIPTLDEEDENGSEEAEEASEPEVAPKGGQVSIAQLHRQTQAAYREESEDGAE